MTENYELKIDSNVKLNIVQSISDAVGDKIKEDIQKNELKTQNSIPTRIWDFLNTDLCARFNSPDCMAYNAKRGWEMIMVYEKASGFLYTFMRENRFAEVRSKIRKRKRMHYVDMLARHLNEDLRAPVGQMSFDEVQFEDEEHLAEAVQKLLVNLVNDGVVVNHHVLVLFESSNYELNSVRAIMVNPNLDIVCEQNWSSYIAVQESVVVDHVKETYNSANNPEQSLKLTAKATVRKNTNPLKHKQKEQEIK